MATSASASKERETLFKFFFLGVLALLLWELARLASPFAPALGGAAALSLAYFPLHTRLARRFDLHENEAAFLSTVAVLLLVLLPFAVFATIVVREAAMLGAMAQKIGAAMRAFQLEKIVPEFLLDLVRGFEIDVAGSAARLATRLAGHITSIGGDAARNIVFLAFNLAIMVLTTFHAFRDGPRLLRWAVQLVPMPGSHKQAILRRIYETYQAIVVGAICAALAQGLLATIGYWIGGVELPLLLGAATTVAALFPGSFLVTVPTALYMLSYDTGRGVFLLIWGLAVVGAIDNILKPILIGSRARLPIIALFFGMFGALRIYGFAGLILGPLLITAVLSFIQIYKQEYYQPTGSEAA